MRKGRRNSLSGLVKLNRCVQVGKFEVCVRQRFNKRCLDQSDSRRPLRINPERSGGAGNGEIELRRSTSLRGVFDAAIHLVDLPQIVREEPVKRRG